MLFIFYAFHALDEMVEMYSALDKREKGALGLLFEMNYFLGLGLTIWIVVKVFTTKPPVEDDYKKLYEFLEYQLVFFFVAIGVMIVGFIFFTILHFRMTRRAKISH